MKIAITGWPRVGKTTLAHKTGLPVRSTDEYKDLGWSEASEAASKLFDEPGPWCVEGVAIPRAARKWLARNPGSAPPWDRLIVLGRDPFEDLTRGQITMGKGLDTVLRGLTVEASILITDDDIRDFLSWFSREP